MTRGAFVASAAAAGAYASIGILRFPADAAEFSYKLALDQATTHPQSIRSAEAAKRVRDASGGQLDIAVYPANQLGDDTAIMSQVRSGAIEFIQISEAIIANSVPAAALDSAPFAFKNYADVFAAVDGPMGDYMRAEIAKIGVYPFKKFWNSGFKQMITGTKAIATPDDLKGLKIRVPPAPVELEIFRSLGASPTPINFAEAYTALQTHLVDGAELPLVTIENGKFYEVQKYVAITNHLWTGYTMLANDAAWQRLPAKLRELTESNFNDSAVQERQDVVALDTSLEQKLKEQGLTINRPNTAPFRTALQQAGFYTKWQQSFTPQGWALLEKAVGKLS